MRKRPRKGRTYTVYRTSFPEIADFTVAETRYANGEYFRGYYTSFADGADFVVYPTDIEIADYVMLITDYPPDWQP